MYGVISKLCRLLIWNNDGKAISISDATIDQIDVRYTDGYTRVIIELRTTGKVETKSELENPTNA